MHQARADLWLGLPFFGLRQATGRAVAAIEGEWDATEACTAAVEPASREPNAEPPSPEHRSPRDAAAARHWRQA